MLFCLSLNQQCHFQYKINIVISKRFETGLFGFWFIGRVWFARRLLVISLIDIFNRPLVIYLIGALRSSTLTAWLRTKVHILHLK